MNSHPHHHTSVVQRRRGLHRRAKQLARRVLPFVAALFLASPVAGPLLKSAAHSAAPRVATAQQVVPAPISSFDGAARQLYQRLGAEQEGLRYEVFQKALTGYLNLQQAGKLGGSQSRLAVVDFDLPSIEKRLWVFDLATHQLLFHTLVAHGHNSGENEATHFSNTDESNMSSLGFYVTGTEYEGKHGQSLRLTGLDEGFNTNAAARSVVMHGADYVSEEFIRQNGRLGRSLGCPALPLAQYAQIISALHDGSCLFINRTGAGYTSKFLNVDTAQQALPSSGLENSQG
ncbi:murein L,D-transpeptidase catalytic domain family protein [Hymenobacter sp. RP-2-7]|uniref:Murein L,D-transpeptidase catalytic domain family protein n=1 Tax=Hymenobacter polaris TaxID=2682546 RepID=A0A7Y0ACX9_9BACT|nr:murein L,D-transpeptidase catalytic domain family protein [Hymenobacter polaris]NML65047.1 murein L,D-transpeptidase catalytic domain family protein [Hymenobacter polaris]